MSGWIKLHRSIQEHWIWEDPIKSLRWIDILMVVNHASKKVNIGDQLFECNRGQSVRSLASWGKRWGVSKDIVRAYFRLLKADGMIEVENIRKSTRITVCNYEVYQGDTTTSSSSPSQKSINNPSQPHTNNNVKNEKKERKLLSNKNSHVPGGLSYNNSKSF